jgi:hypothetical protein
MEPDRIAEYARQFLVQNFTDVQDELPQDEYYVFSVRASSGQLRHYLKIHKNLAINSSDLLDYLHRHNFAGKLKNSNVGIY